MRRLLIVIALVFAHAAWGGDFEDGVAANERKDYATALTKFRSAALQGNRDAQTLLGIMYNEGDGVAQDYKEAMRWYRLAARQGHTLAQHNLGVMYREGRGVAQDYARAHMWFNIASINGDNLDRFSRDVMASRMTAQQIEQAQRMARECMESNFTKCD